MTATVDLQETWQRRRGPRHLLRSYAHMLRYEVTSARLYLPMTLTIQTLIGAGMGIMYGFYLGNVPREAISFLVSGVPALALFPIGFVVVPGIVAGQRLDDTYDYTWSLPVPRTAAAGATFTVFTAVALPGTALALLISTLVYRAELHPNWGIVPAILLSAGMATSVGFALGHGVKDARLVNLLTNLLVFVLLMFSPIVVPIDLFPDWLASVHRVLPFWHMANLVRAGLTNGFVSDLARSYLIAGLWTIGSIALAARVIGRRR